jgi:hypothetical protein
MRKYQDLFDENDDKIIELLNTKRKHLLVLQNDPTSASKKADFATSRKKVQNRLSSMKDKWLCDK